MDIRSSSLRRVLAFFLRLALVPHDLQEIFERG